ncbi:hypothetical protein ZIOFF_005530 [Zingiber officinale]|uniref:Uncharacterized protein n=1 Tax=Zingiber officinale TaxID=94328 RepID=A0A8J5I1J2_ZINOF|nr:hypothetical protein ZIOFF_005530 [Zingiber officinale]
MDDEKSTMPMGNRERDRELLIIPVVDDEADDKASSSASPARLHHPHHSGRELHGILLHLSFEQFDVVVVPVNFDQGLGFVTSVTFIFLVGVFMSSWLGASVLSLGEWFIKRMPFIRHIYNASKQISSAVSPDQNKQAFKEVVIIRHPRVGEYAFGFITSTVILQSYSGEEELCCVYVPTNHLYIGDIFLVNTIDVIRPNLSVSEGIEIVVSGGMSMPQILSTLGPHTAHKRARSSIIYT